jgi:hypothetical protein
MKEHLIWFWNFQHTFKADPKIVSRWYEWLIVKEPIWYIKMPLDRKMSVAVVATGNYLVWIVAELSFLVLLINWRRVSKDVLIVLLIIAGQFLFWGIKRSPALYYMISVVPFYSLLIGCCFKFLLDRFPSRQRYLQVDAAVFAFCCLAVFIYYFPLLNPRPIENSRMNQYIFPGTGGPASDSRTTSSK